MCPVAEQQPALSHPRRLRAGELPPGEDGGAPPVQGEEQRAGLKPQHLSGSTEHRGGPHHGPGPLGASLTAGLAVETTGVHNYFTSITWIVLLKHKKMKLKSRYNDEMFWCYPPCSEDLSILPGQPTHGLRWENNDTSKTVVHPPLASMAGLFP